jgi:NAD(P)-dependent dehydrogenase (short-subunit alcohol dehydrogenase family)
LGRLEGNVTIVTGGNGGIGEAIALKCAAEGAKVVVVGRNATKNANVLKKLEAIGVDNIVLEVDLRNEDEIKKLMDMAHKKYGRIDTLVNNAGIFGNTKDVPQFAKPFEQITGEEWDIIMSVNVRSLFFCCKHAAPIMKNQKSGSIINVSSTTAWLGAPMFLHYGASKGAVITMTKGLAISLAPFNIRVNTLCPGQVMTGSSLSMKKSEEDVEAGILGKQLLQTVTQPEDMAGAVVFLASDEGRMVTGQALGVNGGGFLH